MGGGDGYGVGVGMEEDLGEERHSSRGFLAYADEPPTYLAPAIVPAWARCQTPQSLLPVQRPWEEGYPKILCLNPLFVNVDGYKFLLQRTTFQSHSCL